MNKKLTLGIVILLVLVGGFLLFNNKSSENITQQSSQDITIGYSALRISLPVFVAQEMGYFIGELFVIFHRFLAVKKCKNVRFI